MSLFQAWAKAKRQGICPNRVEYMSSRKRQMVSKHGVNCKG